LGVRVIRLGIFAAAIFYMKDDAQSFYDKCHELSHHMSHPTIIQKGRTRDGQEVLIDDYREAYWWLRDNTPADARVMAWWDYGYQIAGIANRTTIADGNTWNHEHIALLGRALTSPLKEGHRIARHLADYVLIWTGGGGDDVAKSPHMRRIANSVYRFLCPNDPTCRNFGVDRSGQPTPDMQQSLLFQLHSHQLVPGVEADKNRFKLVYQTERGKVRIFKVLSVSKESKAWVANPDNLLCDSPGSWFCPGQYPPALQKILSEKKDFAQLEDFNRKKDGADSAEYTKQYLEHLK
jgi:dolichyl-diphosphooligosaccharide--protein glycosyltransferase